MRQVAADAIAKREAEEEAIREQRAKERESRAAKAKQNTGEEEVISMTAAAGQMSTIDKMLLNLDRIHKRVA